MGENSKIIALIPAAGIGSRMESVVPKQYLGIKGKPILQHTIEAIGRMDMVDRIIVAISEHDTRFAKLSLDTEKPVDIVIGGDERIHSVYQAAKSIKKEVDSDDWLLVHDAVRPCVNHDDVERLFLSIKDHACGGLLATPVTDTIKRIDSIHEVNETIDRSQLWQAQTPQAFRASLLIDALKVRINDYIQTATDEASVMESQGHKPLIVEGSVSNIKVTYPEDLKLAEFILSQ